MQRVFIVHGWEGTPESNWIPWLKKELVAKGFEVHVPQMPNTNDPKMEEWVPYLAAHVGVPDPDTYFVGHSMGCQTILRYLEGLKPYEIVGGVLMVAGFVTIKKEMMAGETKKILGPWVDTKLDLKKALEHSHDFVCISSDNDPYIPTSDAKVFEKQLGAKTIIIPRAGHFTIGRGGYKELHVALNEMLKMLLANTEEYDRRKKSFGKVSDLYDQIRPGYSDQVIVKIIEFSGIRQGARILEIGCGTGQATLPFAQKGYEITALDISPEMIAVAKKKTKELNVTYINSSFEDANLKKDYFDLVISGTAFHFVEPKAGCRKTAEMLKPGGTIALFWNVHNYYRKEFTKGISEFYTRHMPHSWRPIPKGVESSKVELAATKRFDKITEILSEMTIDYSKEDYVKLISTFSWISSSPDREKILADMKETIKSNPEPIKVPYTTILLLTKKVR